MHLEHEPLATPSVPPAAVSRITDIHIQPASEPPRSGSQPSPFFEREMKMGQNLGAQALPIRRIKLWELDHRFHCLVIGTCFTLKELRRIARKAGISIGAEMSDYELHHSFVQVAGDPSFSAKLLNKCLDRKFETTVKRFGGCRSADQLGSLWDQAVTVGDIAGAFWALITHPLAGAALKQRVYGEVHMLSHLAGHSNRSAQNELVALKRRVSELEGTLELFAETSRVRIKEIERRAEALAERGHRVDTLERELAATRAQLAALESGEAFAQLRAEKDTLAQELEHVLQRAEKAERELQEWVDIALSSAPEPRLSIPVVTEGVTSGPAAGCPPPCNAAKAGDCPGPDLCGRRVLYVGGRNRQVAHFRTLVVQHNGELLHHDGGLSESVARLTAMLQSADVVLCPIDCVSHEACLRIKRICKRAAKRFVPLRSASLSLLSPAFRRSRAERVPNGRGLWSDETRRAETRRIINTELKGGKHNRRNLYKSCSRS